LLPRISDCAFFTVPPRFVAAFTKKRLHRGDGGGVRYIQRHKVVGFHAFAFDSESLKEVKDSLAVSTIWSFSIDDQSDGAVPGGLDYLVYL